MYHHGGLALRGASDVSPRGSRRRGNGVATRCVLS